MKATYISKDKQWSISYKTPTGYGRKRITDKTYPNLGKREQDRVRLRMEAMGAELESAAMERISTPALPRTAVDLFSSVQRTTASRTPKTVKEAAMVIERFRYWLLEHHPALLPGELNQAVGREYTAHLETLELTTLTMKKNLQRINWVLEQEGYPKPFKVAELLKDIEVNEDAFTRRAIQQADYRWITRKFLDGTDEGLNIYAIFYLAVMTSWRRSDIVLKEWKDVSFERQTVTTLHRKTRKKTGVTTTLPLTPLGLAILKLLRERNGDSPRVFKVARQRHRGSRRTDEERELGSFSHICDTVFAELMAQRGITRMDRGGHKTSPLSFHSIRRSVLSFLLNNGFPEEVGRTMAGHAPTNVESKHYLEMEVESYRVALELLESHYITPALMELEHPQGFVATLQDTASRQAFEDAPKGMKQLWWSIRQKVKKAGLEEFISANGLSMKQLEIYFSRRTK